LSNSSVREVAKSIGCSFGYISEISSGKRKDITEGYALLICKGLNINPFYVFGASKPRYINWHGSFQKL
jgi:transcriptional regulator with XRE-family HTH domain